NLRNVPVLPIKNSVILPGAVVPLRVGRSQSLAALEQAQKDGNMILAVTQKQDSEEMTVGPSQLHLVGTLAKIEKVSGTPEEGLQVIIRGVSRYRVVEYVHKDGMIWA